MMRTLAAKIFMGMKIMVDLHEPIYHTTPVYHEAPVHHPAAFVHHGGPIHHVAPVHHAVVHQLMVPMSVLHCVGLHGLPIDVAPVAVGHLCMCL